MARGTIITRIQKDGTKRYATAIWINGVHKWKTFGKKGDAERYLNQTAEDVQEGTYRELTPATFKKYAADWKSRYLIPQELKPSTLNGYNSNFEKHLLPRFEQKAMTAITTADITGFRADLLKSGQSIKSVKNLMNLLSRFFADAIEENYLRVSPMPQRRRKSDSRTKGKEGKKGRALQPGEAQQLLAQCDDKLRLVVLLGLLAGLRRGEIFALNFSDIDWENNVINVHTNLFWRYGKYQDVPEDEATYILSTPKSEKSIRTIDLSPTLKAELWTRYMTMQMEDKHGLIFQTSKGTPMDPHNVYEREFKPAVERARKKSEENDDKAAVAAFTNLRMHDLRHTYGSWKVAQGEDILYVSAQMGHARPSITADVYSHLLETRRPKAAVQTDTFLFGAKVVSE